MGQVVHIAMTERRALEKARHLLILLGLVAQASLLFGHRSELRSLAGGYTGGMSLEYVIFLLVPGLVTLAGVALVTAAHRRHLLAAWASVGTSLLILSAWCVAALYVTFNPLEF